MGVFLYHLFLNLESLIRPNTSITTVSFFIITIVAIGNPEKEEEMESKYDKMAMEAQTGGDSKV